jgi:hypothetical protein
MVKYPQIALFTLSGHNFLLGVTMRSRTALKAVDSQTALPPSKRGTEIEKIPGKACLICGVITAGWGNYREGGVVCNAEHGAEYERKRDEARMNRTS